MPEIYLETQIKAPVQVCFDLARSIDLHQISTSKTGEKAIDGKTSGLIQLHETVTWRARHFGIWQELTSVITAFEPPYFFEDCLVSGAFKSFSHGHYFNQSAEITTMRDKFVFTSPLGWLGQLANFLILTQYMRNLLQDRNQIIKQYAESGNWELLRAVQS